MFLYEKKLECFFWVTMNDYWCVGLRCFQKQDRLTWVDIVVRDFP